MFQATNLVRSLQNIQSPSYATCGLRELYIFSFRWVLLQAFLFEIKQFATSRHFECYSSVQLRQDGRTVPLSPLPRICFNDTREDHSSMIICTYMYDEHSISPLPAPLYWGLRFFARFVSTQQQISATIFRIKVSKNMVTKLLFYYLFRYCC
jgi:hypothetical protein